MPRNKNTNRCHTRHPPNSEGHHFSHLRLVSARDCNTQSRQLTLAERSLYLLYNNSRIAPPNRISQFCTLTFPLRGLQTTTSSHSFCCFLSPPSSTSSTSGNSGNSSNKCESSSSPMSSMLQIPSSPSCQCLPLARWPFRRHPCRLLCSLADHSHLQVVPLTSSRHRRRPPRPRTRPGPHHRERRGGSQRNRLHRGVASGSLGRARRHPAWLRPLSWLTPPVCAF